MTQVSQNSPLMRCQSVGVTPSFFLDAYTKSTITRASPTPNVMLHGVFGTQRGGLKCVNGVCRTFPPFAGARAELVIRY